MLLVEAVLVWIAAMALIVAFLWGGRRRPPRPLPPAVPPRAAPYGEIGEPPSRRLVAVLGVAALIAGAVLFALPAVAGATGALTGIGTVLMMAGALLLVVDLVWLKTQRERKA